MVMCFEALAGLRSHCQKVCSGQQLLYQAVTVSCSVAAAGKSLQSCPTLCNPMDYSPPGSSVPGILQARTRVGCHFLLQCMKVAQSCPTLCDPMDHSPSGSSVHEIFQARILEWGAISFFRGSSQPRDQTQVSCTAGKFFTD